MTDRFGVNDFGADGIDFDALDDAEKVKFVEAEIPAALAQLDEMITRLASLRTEVEDPDGLVRFTLGDDGRLVSLFIHDAATTSLTNLALEQKVNNLLAAGSAAMRLSRNELWGSLGARSEAEKGGDLPD